VLFTTPVNVAVETNPETDKIFGPGIAVTVYVEIGELPVIVGGVHDTIIVALPPNVVTLVG